MSHTQLTGTFCSICAHKLCKSDVYGGRYRYENPDAPVLCCGDDNPENTNQKHCCKCHKHVDITGPVGAETILRRKENAMCRSCKEFQGYKDGLCSVCWKKEQEK